jgi:hypothetical protein
MFIYSLAVAVYLSFLGVRGVWVGALLWPAIVLHTVLTVLLAWGWFRARTAARNQQVQITA